MMFFEIDDFLYVTLPRLGLIAAAFISFSFLNLLYRNTVLPLFFSKRSDIRKFGKWVVITGSTDGIGKAFAEILAENGFDLVLISRSNEKLEKVKSEILEKVKVEIKLVCADFTKVDIYEKIENEIKNLDVGLLINNVGMSLEFPDYLSGERNSNQVLSNLINCNCLSATLMTRMVLKIGMMEKGGFVLNISSVAGIMPIPLLSVYGASKAFVNSLTASMEAEVKRRKVYFQTVAPFFVATKMSKMRPSVIAPTPRQYADSVLNRLGTCSFTYGCFVHELQGWIIGFLPHCLMKSLAFKANSSTRERALRKLAKTS